MRRNRRVVLRSAVAFGGAALIAAGGLAWANRCPATGIGYHLGGRNTQWKWDGWSWSEHVDNCHGNHTHHGHTGFLATAKKANGRVKITFEVEGDPWSPYPNIQSITGNDESFTVILATPFFNGKTCLKATPMSLGRNFSGVEVFCDAVTLEQGWLAGKLLNDGGNFRIITSGEAVRHDDYHDVDYGQATEHRVATRASQNLNSQMEGPYDGCGALCTEDKRGGAPKYVLDGQGDEVLDEDGFPQLDLDEDGNLQWSWLPQVATRLTSTVESNGDGTLTYTYVIQNLTGAAIPFNVAQVPVSATATGWSGTVSANSTVETSLTLACGDQDVCIENACLELRVDGANEVNEAVGGQIYVPENLLESTATCVISSITRSALPAQDHVTVLLSGGNAEDIFLFRQTAAGVVCVGEVHGSYVADQSCTVDAEDAPPGPVTYFVSVGKGVNKYNSETSVLENP
jgi:hypothetical protein